MCYVPPPHQNLDASPPSHPTFPTVACSPLPGMWHATLPTLALASASHLLSVISYLLPGMIWQCGVSPSIYQMGHVTLPTLTCPSFPSISMPPLSCHQLLLSWQCGNMAMWQCSMHVPSSIYQTIYRIPLIASPHAGSLRPLHAVEI